MTILFLGISFMAAYFLQMRGSYDVTTSNNMEIKLKDCELLIQQGSNYFDYWVPAQLWIDRLSEVSQSSSGNTDTYTFENAYPGANCRVILYLNEAINSLDIECSGDCDIVQSSEQLEVSGSVNIAGDNINANFRDISVA